MSQVQALSNRSDLHIARKLWHMLTGCLGLAAYYATPFASKDVGFGLIVFAIFAFSFDIARLKVKVLGDLSLKLFGPFMRESERDSLAGLPFYALGVGVSLFFYQEDIAIISTLFLIFADPICSAVGITMGSQKLIGNKSLEGTVACFICCYVLVMAYGLMYFPLNINLFVFAILAAFAGAIAELVSTKIDDNLTIPVISGGIMTFINLILNVA